MFEAMGLSPMAGRVWAALLVTDRPHLSATELQEQIGASAGSVSGVSSVVLICSKRWLASTGMTASLTLR